MRDKSRWLSDGKNWAMLNTRVLVDKFFTQPVWMMWIRATPASIIDLNLRPPSWLRWIKLFEAVLNWRHSLMTFPISLLTVLRRTIGLKALGESYDFLLDLGIMIVVDLLKCEGQYPTLIQALVMLIMTLRHLSSLKIAFKWLHDNLSGPEADKLLQLASVILNSSFEKVGHDKIGLSVISLRTLTSTWWWRAILNVEWRAFQRSSILRHWQLLYLIDLIAGNLYLLTQFISS